MVLIWMERLQTWSLYHTYFWDGKTQDESQGESRIRCHLSISAGCGCEQRNLLILSHGLLHFPLWMNMFAILWFLLTHDCGLLIDFAFTSYIFFNEQPGFSLIAVYTYPWQIYINIFHIKLCNRLLAWLWTYLLQEKWSNWSSQLP